jgi:uncharacterized HAD superfamily protein
MIIGIDVDGVLTDIYAYTNKNYKEFTKSLGREPKKFKKSTTLFGMYGWTREEDDRFWNEHVWDYAKNVSYKKSASKYLNKLHEEGHKLYIVTKRQYFGLNDENGKRMEKLLLGGLKKAGIYYDKVISAYVEKSKVPCIIDNKIDIMIDDEFYNLEKISELIPTICYDHKYNSDFEFKNMHRCKNWKEIYLYINDLSR